MSIQSAHEVTSAMEVASATGYSLLCSPHACMQVYWWAHQNLAGCAGQPSLAEGSPQVAAQWHPSLNDKTPAEVTCASRLRAWWLCKEGQCGHHHVWDTQVQNRVKQGNGCPICAGKKPCQCNSLAVTHPDIIQQQWDFERNTVRPEDLLPRSSAKVHWRCSLHQPPCCWTATPTNRFARLRTGCPECAYQRKFTQRPELEVPSPLLTWLQTRWAR